MRNTPKMNVIPAETRNSQDANVMPSIRMIGRIFMRTAPQQPLRAEWDTARPRPQRALTLRVGARSDAKANRSAERAAVRTTALAPRALALFPGRPAFDPLDRLLALRRSDIGGGENPELVEDGIAERGVLLSRGEAPPRLVHCLMILAHEDAAARCVKLQAFHRNGDLLSGRPSAVLHLDGFFDRGLQPIEGLRHEGPLVVRHTIELGFVAPEILAVAGILVRIRILEVIAAAGKGRALGKNLRLVQQASRHNHQALLEQAARLALIDEAGQAGAPVDGVDHIRL